MKIKIIAIFVMTLLITTAISAMGMTPQNNVNEELIPHQTSCVRAPYISNEVEKTTKPYNIAGTPFYGYIAYDPTSVLPLGPCSFLPATPGVITSLLPTISIDFISGGTWAAGTWYGCEYALAGGQPLIWTISTAGVMTPVGSYDLGVTGLSFNGLAYNPTTGIMYGCSSSDLYTINMATGASTWVGSFGITGGLMIAIAFDGSGNLYGTEITFDLLYSINPANAAVTPVGAGLGIDISYAQDMAFDLDTNTLYLSAFTIAPLFEGALYTCNPVTGVATKVGTFMGGAEVTGFAIPYSTAPTPPKITGPSSGKPGTSYSWTFHSYDNDTQEIYYVVDWGDGTMDTTQCMPPCTPVTLSHTYTSQGVYTIKAKAVECPPGVLESTWSQHQVTIPRSKAIQNLIFLQFLENHPNMLAILERFLHSLGL